MLNESINSQELATVHHSFRPSAIPPVIQPSAFRIQHCYEHPSPPPSSPSAPSRWSSRRRNGTGAKCQTSTSGISRTSTRRDDAWRQAKDKLAAEFPKLQEFKGTLELVGGDGWLTRWSSGQPAVEGVRARLRLRQHDVGHRHARQQVPGHAAGDGPARLDARRRGGVHRTGDPEDRHARRSTSSSPASRG